MPVTATHCWLLDDGPWNNTDTTADSVGSATLTAETGDTIEQEDTAATLKGAGVGAGLAIADSERFALTIPPSTATPSTGKTYELAINADATGSNQSPLAVGNGAGALLELTVQSGGALLALLFLSSTNYSVLTDSSVVTAGEDVHVLISIPASAGEPTIYINGAAAAASSSPQSLTNRNRLAIGSRAAGSPTVEFGGKIYRASVYSGAADAADAAALYAQARGGGSFLQRSHYFLPRVKLGLHR